MDSSQYAFVQGMKSTRTTLAAWNREPGPVLRSWVLGSLGAATVLLGAVWLVAVITPGAPPSSLRKPPFFVGDARDVAHVLFDNSLLLALHALACRPGLVAGSQVPPHARARRRLTRLIDERRGARDVGLRD